MNRNFFLSYSRADKDRLGHLLRGLDRLHHHVWMDEQLEGGQQWWDEVLGQIRTADALIVALSPAALESTACRLEYRYAAAVGKPVVPVMVEPFNPDLLPTELARVQLVDFTSGNEQAPFDLMAALSGLPDPPPLPDPLPEAPPVPLSYLSGLGETIQQAEMTLDEQYAAVRKLKGGLERPRERDAVLQLMSRFRGREDLYAGPARELEAAYLEAIEQERWAPPAGQPSTPAPLRDPSRVDRVDLPAQTADPAAASSTSAANEAVTGTRRAPGHIEARSTRRSRVPLAIGLAALLTVGGGAAVALMNKAAPTAGPENGGGVSVSETSSSHDPVGPSQDRPKVGDACLVGDWVSTGASGYQTFDNGDVAQLSEGAGASLTIDEDGTATLDYAGSDPVRYTMADGVMTAQFSGTTRSVLSVAEDGTVKETLLSNGATYVVTAGSAVDTERPSVFAPTAQYSCTSDTATFSDADGLIWSYERQ